MFEKFHEATEDEGELNLIPVMNLFMVIIPFLLMGAAFIHIAVIPTSTPTHDPHQADVPKTPKTVAGNLVIQADKINLTFSSTSLTPDQLDALSAEWPAPGGKYDLKALQQKLVEVKAKYPHSNTLTVLPDNSVNYQQLVAILDVTRARKIGKYPNGDTKYQELFPVTVFSRLIRAKKPPAGTAPAAKGGGK